MNRSEAKKLVRQALIGNSWMRTGASGDTGDNCYLETFAYMGNEPPLRGCTIKVEWGDSWMEVALPRNGSFPSRDFDRLNAYLEYELGWSLDAVGSRGDRLYATDTGVELLIVFSQNDVTFNTALPRVRKS